LRGMQERVTALGGNLTIGNRSQEKGAVIDAVIPQTHQSPVRAGAIA
jgi:signal transduction histidine kinase